MAILYLALRRAVPHGTVLQYDTVIPVENKHTFYIATSLWCKGEQLKKQYVQLYYCKKNILVDLPFKYDADVVFCCFYLTF